MENKKRWYRKWDLDVSRETVEAIVAQNTTPDKYNRSSLGGEFTPPDSEDLNGKTLVFRGEGKVFTFEIVSTNLLRFSEEGGCEAKECFTNVKTLNHEVYLINQIVPGYAMSRQVSLIADMKTGCATVVDAHFGTPYSNIDVGREFIFGKLDGEFEGGEMHHFTDELVGKAMAWNYGTGKMTIKHMYTSNLYYTYSAATPQMGAWMATNPADYVKIRDNIYIFSFVEERQHGLQALFVIDFNLNHDMGCFYGVGKDHVTSSCIGAEGTPAACTTIF